MTIADRLQQPRQHHARLDRLDVCLGSKSEVMRRSCQAILSVPIVPIIADRFGRRRCTQIGCLILLLGAGLRKSVFDHTNVRGWFCEYRHVHGRTSCHRCRHHPGYRRRFQFDKWWVLLRTLLIRTRPSQRKGTSRFPFQRVLLHRVVSRCYHNHRYIPHDQRLGLADSQSTSSSPRCDFSDLHQSHP